MREALRGVGKRRRSWRGALASAILLPFGCGGIVTVTSGDDRGAGGDGGQGTGTGSTTGTTTGTGTASGATTTGTGTATGTGSGTGTGTGTDDCSACHGNEVNPAPPVSTLGETTTIVAAVGAHQWHLTSSDWHLVRGCTQCHSPPLSTVCPNYEEQHCDDELQLVWGDLATAGGASPEYDWWSHSCSGTYCHGATLASEPVFDVWPLQEPVWNHVDGSYVECGVGCHTNPPATPGHEPYETTRESCHACHSAVIIWYDQTYPPATTWRDKNLHINGIVEVDE